ncbi:MAG: bifunctional metallophosphatase/5'-nucleotidase [Anaerolineales bacterium]
MTARRAALILCSMLPVAVCLTACGALSFGGMASRQSDTVRHLVILYTNDEHGWMEPYQKTGGAAGLARLWKRQEGLGEKQNLLVLSGGDMWTGPALSSALQGESMADVLNAMGYAAAAIGNHDFDFGIEALKDRRAQSSFPFLAANLHDRATGELPDFAEPYLLTEVNGIKVGVIGLTTIEARIDTNPTYVAGLDFLPYRDVLPGVAAEARAAGAELLIVIGHLCVSETRALAPLASELGIPIIGGGHCHEEIQETVDGVLLVESGYFFRGYKRIELLFDTRLDQVVELQADQIPNGGSRADPALSAMIEGWRARTDPGLWEVIGYTDRQISRDTPEMAALLLEPWLMARPEADVALADIRYVQQDLFPGEITVASIWGLLPTTNELVQVELAGGQLIELIESRRPLVAGMTTESEYHLRDGEPIDRNAVYRILVSDSLYAGGNYFELFRQDPDPIYLDQDWRLPAIDWIRSLRTSRDRPIGDLLAVPP